MAVPRGVNRRSAPQLAWHWTARDLSLVARTGLAGTLTRATRNRWTQDGNGLYYEAVDHAPTFTHYFDATTGLYKFGGLAIHNGAQEIGVRSTEIANDGGFGWNNTGRFTFSDAASRFGGKVAKRALNDNTSASTARTLAMGTPGAVPRTAWFMIENVDATVCDIGMASSIDVFTSGIRGQLTFATGATAVIAGAGTVTARKVSPTVWLVTVSRTMVAGHGYTAVYYLTGTAQNALTTICHGAGVVDGKHVVLIPTVGAALTANADAVTWSLANIPPSRLAETGFTFYESYVVDRHIDALTMDCTIIGGTDVGGNNALMISVDGSASRIAARWQTPGGNNSSTVTPAGFAAAYVPGALIERSVQVTAAGAATASLRVNGGAVNVGAATPAIGYPSAWASSVISLSDQATAERKGHRLQRCAGLAVGLYSLDLMSQVCA